MVRNQTPRQSSGQEGFHFILILIIIALIGIGFVGWRVVGKKQSSTNQTPGSAKSEVKEGSNTPPLKLKSIGFNLDYYNPATNMAGDIKFTRYNLFNNQIWADFGQQDTRSPNDPSKKNVQPIFYLPLDTKVLSLVDGVVVDVVTLYSGDVSIMVAKDNKSNWIYETEHVINPLVKKGDRVTGGQVIASISPHGSPGPGIGVLDIGILHPEGTEAGHVCPFKYLDDSIKADIQKKITALYKSWEDYLGKNVYDEANMVSPGCVTEDWARG